MTCPDCLADGKNVSCVFDFKQMGEVCPRCERVYSPTLAATPRHKHYATERGVKRRMARDKKEREDVSVSTHALIDRIMRSN
jgi:hypothetical protein